MFIKKLSFFFIKLKYKLPIFFGFILLFILYTYIPLVYAVGHAEILSDEVLDTIYVGGFDFNINAAYAFRAAVAGQTNIAAISCVNSKGNITINATNEAMVANQGDSAVANQLNLNAVVAKAGDILNTKINNLNIADVANMFINEGGAEPEVGVEASSISFNASGDTVMDTLCPGVSVVPTESTVTSSIPANAPEPVTITPVTSAPPIDTNPVEAPTVSGTINKATANASSVSAQTNIAAVVALNGDIVNTEINNTNIASVENHGNSALAVQTNIAIIVSKNDIKNTVVKNLNIADVINTNTTNFGGAKARSLSLQGVLMNFSLNDVVAKNGAVASQVNVTFVKSLRGNIKNAVIKKLNLNRVINIH